MILVAGATGRLGGLVVRMLLERGERVRALVRDPSASVDLAAAGAEVVVGDLKDAASVRAASDGVNAVVTTANSMSRGGDDNVDSVDRAGNANLVDAASEHNVERFVFVSALGADLNHPMPFMRAKAETELRLRDSAMAWTVLQPDFYMELLAMAVVGGPVLSGQPVTLVGEGRRRHSLVSMTDVAAYAVAALLDVEARAETFAIGGPDAMSWIDVVAAFERELQREVPVRFVPVGEAVPGLPDPISGLLAALETYDSPVDMSGLSTRFGIRPTSLADFVHGVVSSAPASPDSAVTR